MSVVALAMLSGCQLQALQIHNDKRLTFQAPHARQRVTVPLAVRWDMRDFTAVGLDGSRDNRRGVYAVFVDTAPMPVGKDLKWLFRNDKSCQRDARCPSEQQLLDKGVHVTKGTSIDLESLPPSNDGVGDEQHYINIVLLDGTGKRGSESAWYMPFSSKRRKS